MLRTFVLIMLLATLSPLAAADVDPCDLAGCPVMDCDVGVCTTVRPDAVCGSLHFGTQSAGACALPKATCAVAWVGWSAFPVCLA